MRIMCDMHQSFTCFYERILYTKSNFYPPPPLLRGVHASPRRAGRRRGGIVRYFFRPRTHIANMPACGILITQTPLTTPHPYCKYAKKHTLFPKTPPTTPPPYCPKCQNARIVSQDTPYHPAKKNALTPLPPFDKIKWKMLCLCTTRRPPDGGLFFFPLTPPPPICYHNVT